MKLPRVKSEGRELTTASQELNSKSAPDSPELMPRRRVLQAGTAAIANLLLPRSGGSILTRALAAIAGTSAASSVAAATRTFIHPGLLHTEEDFARIREKLAVGAQPWVDGWNVLISNGYAHLGAAPRPLITVVRGGTGQNFAQLYIDVQRTYRLAVRWKVSQDPAYAEDAIRFLNAWSSTLTTITGNADRWLAAGIYGYQFANAAEIMRSYEGWAAADIERFQKMLLNIFYPLSSHFLKDHNGAVITNYWANWDQCSIAAVLAIGVFCDRPDIYDEALHYYKYGQGNGASLQAVAHVHPGYLGQWQESGRDQGHSTLGISLGVAFCEMAWNQGDDMYGYDNNRFLAGAEYVAKSNLVDDTGAYYQMPWKNYHNRHGLMTQVSTHAIGNMRPCWEAVYNHYAMRKGISAPFVGLQVQQQYPEANGINGDQLGFGTLLFSRDLEATDLRPSGVTAYARGDKVVLSWWGVVEATSYTVERAAASNGPFRIIASGIEGLLTYEDFDLVGSASYYYRVRASIGNVETAASDSVRLALEPEVVFHLAFDEGSGDTAADSAGSWGDSALLNGAAWGTGPGNAVNALILDGLGSYVQVPVGPLSKLGDFTIEASFYADEIRTWSRLFDFGSGERRWMTLNLSDKAGVPLFSTSPLHGYMYQGVASSIAFPLGRWVHVAVTLHGNTCRLYIDRIEVGRNDAFDFAPFQLGPAGAAYLGRSQYSADPYTKGRYDYFKIWSGALSSTQIAALSNR